MSFAPNFLYANNPMPSGNQAAGMDATPPIPGGWSNPIFTGGRSYQLGQQSDQQLQQVLAQNQANPPPRQTVSSGGRVATPQFASAPAPTPTQQAQGNQNAPPKQGATPKLAAPASTGANYGYAPLAPHAGAAPTAPSASAAPVAPVLQTPGFQQATPSPHAASPLATMAPINPLHAAIQRQAASQGMQTGVFSQDPRLSFGGFNL